METDGENFGERIWDFIQNVFKEMSNVKVILAAISVSFKGSGHKSRFDISSLLRFSL